MNTRSIVVAGILTFMIWAILLTLDFWLWLDRFGWEASLTAGILLGFLGFVVIVPLLDLYFERNEGK